MRLAALILAIIVLVGVLVLSKRSGNKLMSPEQSVIMLTTATPPFVHGSNQLTSNACGGWLILATRAVVQGIQINRDPIGVPRFGPIIADFPLSPEQNREQEIARMVYLIEVLLPDWKDGPKWVEDSVDAIVASARKEVTVSHYSIGIASIEGNQSREDFTKPLPIVEVWIEYLSDNPRLELCIERVSYR